MKKLLSVLLVLCMVFGLAACGEKKPAAPTAKDYTLGLGVVLNDEEAKGSTAQHDATFVAVVWDAEGKIVSARFDCAQNKVKVEDGVVDMTATFPTKMEKGDNYNMKTYGNSKGEWYEEVHFLEEWLVGKTVADVENMPLDKESNPGHTISGDATLTATMTMSIVDFNEAVVKAFKDDAAVKFSTADAFTVGVASISEFDGATKDATAEEDGVVAVYENYAAVVLGADGKILAALSDATQPKTMFNQAGELTDFAFKATKRELKEDYNMVKFSESEKEWYVQSANFTNYIVGMTAADVKAIPTAPRADGLHEGYIVATDADLFAQCSISLPGFQNVVALACSYAH